MADVAIPGVATVNPGAGDTVLGVQGGLVKRFSVGTDTGLALGSEVSAVKARESGGLGDFSVDGKLLIFCGDSTTEQMQGSGYGFDRLTTLHRANGGRLSKIIGTINFGGSGYQLDDFVSQPAGALPVIQSATNAGVGAWDYYGHKPTGAISLSTALAWREGKAEKVVWVICLGINDCILNASVGTLSQAEISAYIAQRLRTAVSLVNAAYPQDDIVLRVPNPMTARPYNAGAGFPSSAAYPTFGQDEASDRALVEKWNQGLRNAYLSVRAIFPRTILFDTWTTTFGESNTSLIASTHLPYLGDLVHPSQSGYIGVADSLVDLLAPRKPGSMARRREADLRAAALGGDPWTYYPLYFRENPAYARKIFAPRLIAIGSNYIDIEVSLLDFASSVDLSRPIYVVIGDAEAQAFSAYSAGVAGANTRLTSVAPSTAMQASNGHIEVFQKVSSSPASDLYIVQQLASLKPRRSFTGKIAAGGAGFFDVTLDASADNGRFSTKFLGGLSKAKVLVGGGTDATVSLSSATGITRNGATSARSFRVLIAGDYASYANKAAAVTFDDAANDPGAYEAVFTQRGVVPHAQNARGFVHCPLMMADGATLSVFMTEAIGQEVTVEIYRAKWATRTLIGTVTVGANLSGASLSSGNPTTVEAGTIYEFVVTSATSQSTGLVGLSVTPA